MILKKSLEMLGLAVLICFSFFLTEKTTIIMKENDSLMTTVKEKSKELEISSIDAQIINDEIIPGISGKTVDVEKSYQAMKPIGVYNTKLVVYQTVEPKLSLKENYDKYVVGGNHLKKQVSIILKIENNENIDSILNLLKENKMVVNFFITSDWSMNKIEKLKEMSTQGHVIGSLETNIKKNNLVHSFLKINTNQQNDYCYIEEKNDDIINHCAKNKRYTILPSLVIKNNLLSEVMKNVKSGSIISIEINNRTSKELSNTLNYIYSKGYEVVTLDKLLQE